MENKNGQGIFYGVIGVATLVVAIIGATFAYFSATIDPATNAINATTAAGASIALTVSEVQPSDTATVKGMVPLDITATSPKTSQFASAVSNNTTGTDGICTDANGNTVCHIYKIVIQNSGDAAVLVSGNATIASATSNKTLDHASWGILGGNGLTDTDFSNATVPATIYSIGGTGSGTGVVAPTGTLLAASGGTKTYYMLVWVEEIDDTQPEDADARILGTVTFTTPDGTGVTAKF